MVANREERASSRNCECLVSNQSRTHFSPLEVCFKMILRFLLNSIPASTGSFNETLDPKRFSSGSGTSSEAFTPPSRPPSRGASEWGGADNAPQPGTSAWLRERTLALEAERSGLVRFTLELQGLLDQVKGKLRSAPPKRTQGDHDEEIDRWMRDVESLISEKQVRVQHHT